MCKEKSFDVFLSYHPADSDLAENLAVKLEDEAHLHVWFDKWELIPGKEWHKDIEVGIKNASAFVVLISNMTLIGWFENEIKRAKEIIRGDEDFQIIPVLLPGSTPDKLTLSITSQKYIDLRDGINDKKGFRELVTEIKELVPAPVEIPPRAEFFVGREREIKELLNKLKPGAVVTITGPGGIGKTALVAETLYRLTDNGIKVPDLFPDGIVSYCFYGKPGVDLALEHILIRYGAEVRPPLEEAARLAIGDKQALLVLDGTEEADHLDTILKIRGRCCVLVTSRSRADIHDAWQDLTPLEVGEAMKLLQAWGRSCIDDLFAAQQICELVGGLPLALRLAGKYMLEHGEMASEYVAWLNTTPLHALDQGSRRTDSLTILLEKTLEQVSERAREVMGVIGLLALGSFDVELIAAGLNWDERSTLLALGELVKYGLVNREGKNYIVSHALVHTYTRLRVRKPDGSLERLVKALGEIVYKINQSGLPEKFIPLRAHVRVMAEEAEKANLEEAGWLWNSLGYHFNEVAEYTGAKAAYQRAIRIDEIIFGFDHPNIARDVNNLGSVLHVLGDYEGAKEAYERALEIDMRAFGSNNPKVAIRTNNLGMVLKEMGDFEAAQIAFEKALAIFLNILGPTHPNVATIILNHGSVLQELGNLEGALSAYEQALAIDEEIHGTKHPSVARDANKVGTVLYELGDYVNARVFLERALAIDESTYGLDHPTVARDITSVAMVMQQLGDLSGARAAYERALAIDEAAFGPDHPTVARDINNIGIVLQKIGDHLGAQAAYERALAIDEAAFGPDHITVARDINNLGMLLQDLGDSERARLAFERALTISRKYFSEEHLNIQRVKESLESLTG